MNARDELAKTLFVTDNHNAKDADAEWKFLQQTPKYLAAYHHMAAAILAAGYSKPRQVSTVEELDALPVGSVVLHNGRAFQHYPAHPAPFDEYQKWKCGDGGFVRSTKDGRSILPATVLHEPPTHYDAPTETGTQA